MLAEARRPCLGICVRNGEATLALLGPRDLCIVTLRLRQWPRGERPSVLQHAVRTIMRDPYRTLVVTEPKRDLIETLIGQAHGIHGLSLPRVLPITKIRGKTILARAVGRLAGAAWRARR